MQEGVYLAPLQGEAFMARSSFWQDWSVQVPMDCPDKACADWLGWTGDLSWAKPGCPPPPAQSDSPGGEGSVPGLPLYCYKVWGPTWATSLSCLP